MNLPSCPHEPHRPGAPGSTVAVRDEAAAVTCEPARVSSVPTPLPASTRGGGSPAKPVAPIAHVTISNDVAGDSHQGFPLVAMPGM